MSVKHVMELFALDGRAFVTSTYQQLLGRDPDPDGMAYYLGRLAVGYSKESIVAQIALSPEARHSGKNFAGLNALITEQRRANHWFWRWVGSQLGLERILRQRTHSLQAIEQNMVQLVTCIQALTESVKALPIRIDALCAAKPLEDARLPPMVVVPRLSEDEVRAAFRDVLGREPESEQTITHHTALPNVHALRQGLLNSSEYRNKPQGAYARLLLSRMAYTIKH